MAKFLRFSLVNVALGLTVAAIASSLWASTVQSGHNVRYWFADALWMFANNLSTLLVLVALCTWILAGVVALIRLRQRHSKQTPRVKTRG